MTLRIRTADPKKEAAALADGMVRAFRLGDPEYIRAFYRDAPYVAAGETLVAEDAGVLAAQATTARLTMMLAGAEVPLAGITLVACAPEHRRRGAVDRLMRALVLHMRKRREPVTALYPFYEPFYAKFGYARVEWSELFAVPPTMFPASDLRRCVRRVDPAKDLAGLGRCYDRWRAGTTGPQVRTPYWWKARVFGKVKDGVVFVGPRSRALEGYLLYDPSGSPNQIASDFTIKELVAATPDARRGLYGFLHALGEQFRRIHHAIPRGEGAPALTGIAPVNECRFSMRNQEVATVLAGAMLRIVDLRHALAAHPAPARNRARGTIGVDLTDPVLKDQNGSFDLSFDDRGASAQRGKRSKARLALGIGALSQVYASAARARGMLAAGAIDGHDDAAALLDEAFAGPAPFWGELNGF